jgi:hypothetical protein
MSNKRNAVEIMRLFKHTEEKGQQRQNPQQNQRGHPSQQNQQQNDTLDVFRVIIPQGISPGQQFQTYVGSRIVLVPCPLNGRPGQELSISVPRQHQIASDTSQDSSTTGNASAGTDYVQQRQERQPERQSDAPRPPARKDTALFEVTVPPGVQPGRPFSLIAGGQRIVVNCPTNARQGDRIRFNVPVALLEPPKTEPTAVAKIRIKYNKDGWARNVRLTDMKFQWIRVDDNGDIDIKKRFDVDRSAYVRKFSNVLSLVPAADAVADTCIKDSSGRELVSYNQIVNAQVLPFEQKAEWFQDTCARILKVPWSAGHMQMNVRRESIVVDSLNCILTMNKKDLRKHWRFHFLGEPGIDAGGLTRIWFQLVTEEIFNGDMGLWQSSAVNQMCMQINPVSGKSRNINLASPKDLYSDISEIPITFYYSILL